MHTPTLPHPFRRMPICAASPPHLHFLVDSLFITENLNGGLQRSMHAQSVKIRRFDSALLTSRTQTSCYLLRVSDLKS